MRSHFVLITFSEIKMLLYPFVDKINFLLLLVFGEIFKRNLLLQRAFCAYCNDRIWGLGRQGFKCIQCKLLVHKKCHKAVNKPCTSEHQEPVVRDDHNGEAQAISTPVNEIVPDIRERDFPEPPPDVTGNVEFTIFYKKKINI